MEGARPNRQLHLTVSDRADVPVARSLTSAAGERPYVELFKRSDSGPSTGCAQRPDHVMSDAAGLIDTRASPIEKAEPIPLLTGRWNVDQDEALLARSGRQTIVESDDLER